VTVVLVGFQPYGLSLWGCVCVSVLVPIREKGKVGVFSSDSGKYKNTLFRINYQVKIYTDNRSVVKFLFVIHQ
jgi:hypothetical protein